MPIKITNAEGKEEEVYTSAEIEEQRQTAVKEYQDKNPDKTEALNKAEELLKELNEKLEKVDDKNMNFGELRKQKEAAEKAVKDLSAQIDEKVGAAKKEILEGVMKDHYNDVVKSLADGDAELQKKIELQYKRLGDSAATKEEITKKLTDAYILATGKKVDEGALNSSVLSSGGGRPIKTQGNQNFTAEEKALAQKMAQAGGMKLEDKDFK